jgi:hypothetical protein
MLSFEFLQAVRHQALIKILSSQVSVAFGHISTRTTTEVNGGVAIVRVILSAIVML